MKEPELPSVYEKDIWEQKWREESKLAERNNKRAVRAAIFIALFFICVASATVLIAIWKTTNNAR